MRVCVERFGFESVRITGGEPTVRAHLPRLVAMLAPLGVDIAMTTQRRPAPGDGARPRRRRACGASTCRSTRCGPTSFRELTRRDDLDRVIAGIDAALDAGLDPVKVNCVVIRGVNDDEVVDLAAFGRERGRRRALHRVHAARRRGRVDAGPGRARRRDPRADRRGVPARAPHVAGLDHASTSSRPSGSATPTASATSA